MYKKLFAALIFTVVAAANLNAYSTDRSRPDVWRTIRTDLQTGKSTEAVVVDADGDFNPGLNERQTLGESSHTWAVVYTSRQVVTGGLPRQVNFIDMPATSSLSWTNGVIWRHTLAAFDAGRTSTTVDLFQSSGPPRNVVMHSSAAEKGVSTHTLVMSATIFGFDHMGYQRQETITLSTTPADGIGNVAWATISSVTVSFSSRTQDTTDLDAIVFMGTGEKIGFTFEVQNTSDVYKITEDGVDVVLTDVTIDLDHDTIDFKTTPIGTTDATVHALNRRSRPE